MTTATAPRKVRRPAAGSGGSVVLQARVDYEFARVLVEHDAMVLGLNGASEVVREGLRLLHRHAREMEAAAEIDAFYGGQPAPLPAGVVPAGVD